MILTGIARLGRDVEVRFTSGGQSVASLSLAYDYGQKVDGKRPSQWIDASLWGKQAESLEPYLKKGTAWFVICRDVRIEEYEGKNGKGSKLAATVIEIEFVPRQKAESTATVAAQAPRAENIDEEIPF